MRPPTVVGRADGMTSSIVMSCSLFQISAFSLTQSDDAAAAACSLGTPLCAVLCLWLRQVLKAFAAPA
jgi:hypothetical protein